MAPYQTEFENSSTCEPIKFWTQQLETDVVHASTHMALWKQHQQPSCKRKEDQTTDSLTAYWEIPSRRKVHCKGEYMPALEDAMLVVSCAGADLAASRPLWWDCSGGWYVCTIHCSNHDLTVHLHVSVRCMFARRSFLVPQAIIVVPNACKWAGTRV